MTDLRERASKAFTPEFRAAIADACQRELRRIKPKLGCMCPEGALTGTKRPQARQVATWCERNGFQDCADYRLHLDFQCAFDMCIESCTPESALGLLYRERLSR
jgi:hypothetical protein